MLSKIKNLEKWNKFFTLLHIQTELNKINEYLINEHKEFDGYFDIFPYGSKVV